MKDRPKDKSCCLLKGITYDQMTTAVCEYRAHHARNKEDFDVIVAYLSKYEKKQG